MSDKAKPSKTQILVLCFAFSILFILVFSLGIIVGKGVANIEAGTKMTSKRVDQGIDDSESPREALVDNKLEAREEGIKSTSRRLSPTRVSDVAEEYPLEVSQKQSLEQDASVQKQPSSHIGIEIEKSASTEKERTAKESLELPSIAHGGRWTVQIASFRNKDKADRFVRLMKSKGYPVFIKSVKFSDGKILHRLRIGTFDSKEKANIYGERLKELEPDVTFLYTTVND